MKPRTLLASCLALAMAGCASSPFHQTTMRVQALQALGQYHWSLQQATNAAGAPIDELMARPDKPLQLDFRRGLVQVGNACNVLSGKVQTGNGTFSVPVMTSTMMACADPAVSALDGAVSSRLQQPVAYRIDTHAAPPTLTLVTADKDHLVFTGTPSNGS